MELTRKQKILLGSLGGVALLLLFGLVFWIVESAGDPVPVEPTLPVTANETPAPTDTPSPSPSPVPTPSPTPYRLPLVPQGGMQPATPAPSPSPEPTPEPQAQGAADVPVIRTDARVGVYQSDRKEFLAIGTLSGEAVAVLLVQVKPPETTVLALPAETLAPVYTLGEHCAIRSVDTAPLGTASARAGSLREGCWNLIWAIKNLTGYQAPEYLCVDLGCMESFFAYAPRLTTEDGDITLSTFRAALNEEGAARARRMGALGVGAVKYLREVSLWELPGFRNATRDAFSSSLSVPELLFLMVSLRAVTDFKVDVLPTSRQNGDLILASAAIPF